MMELKDFEIEKRKENKMTLSVSIQSTFCGQMTQIKCDTHLAVGQFSEGSFCFSWFQVLNDGSQS